MRVRVPRYLHLPQQILWFDMEDLALMGCLYFLWLLVDHWAVLVLSVLAIWQFKSLKAEKPRGFVRHILYRYGFIKVKVYPSPTVKVFKE